jgi:hypothetical protein
VRWYRPAPLHPVLFENPNCSSNLELRYFDDRYFELHDYGALFKDKDFQTAITKMIEEQRLINVPAPAEPAKVFQFPKGDSK